MIVSIRKHFNNESFPNHSDPLLCAEGPIKTPLPEYRQPLVGVVHICVQGYIKQG